MAWACVTSHHSGIIQIQRNSKNPIDGIIMDMCEHIVGSMRIVVEDLQWLAVKPYCGFGSGEAART